MNMRILQLPPAIANQIAAGEVIERPASVVKELLENSLDAGATIINIDINYGGLNQIKISDNGLGIIKDDLPLAIAAHATSKITSLDDLYAINSLGFRGEALASIASVARVSISSKPKSQEHAMQLTTQGCSYTLTACARAEGTTIDVCDLFYNAPVRKRFLKSERVEFQAVEAVVKRFALSAPHIAITFTHNNKQVLSLPAALNEQTKQLRMTKILGGTFVKNALFIDVDQGSMRLYGWISGVNYQRSQNDRQWVYLNQRMIKDKLINHAIKQAYVDLLYPGRFPSCLLYFSLNTREVDVNVHPTKHEVRFQQPRLVHDFFSSHLVKALHTQSEAVAVSYSTDSEREMDCFVESAIKSQPSNFEKSLTCAKNDVREPTPQFVTTKLKSAGAFHERTHEWPVCSSTPQKSANIEQVPWTVLNKRYCLLWIHKQPYLVDVLEIYQAWLQQNINPEQSPLASRPLLVAVRYPAAPHVQQRMYELQRSLLSLGIVIEEHANELIIRSVPIMVPYLNIKLFFEQLGHLEDYSLANVQHELVHSQLVDAQQLSVEERAALSEYVLTIQNNTTNQSLFFKPLTMDDCRMLLHV
jgi:DNA mismatch repair protein MutL